jgi:hypothetical protein
MVPLMSAVHHPRIDAASMRMVGSTAKSKQHVRKAENYFFILF